MSSPGASAFAPSPQPGGSPTPAPHAELAHHLLEAVLQRDGVRARALVAQWREQRGFASLTAFRTTTLAMKAGPAGCDWLVALLEAPASAATEVASGPVAAEPAPMDLPEHGPDQPSAPQPPLVADQDAPVELPSSDGAVPLAADAALRPAEAAAAEPLPAPELEPPLFPAIELQLDRPEPTAASWMARPAAASPAISFDLTPPSKPSVVEPASPPTDGLAAPPAAASAPASEANPVAPAPAAASAPQRWSHLSQLWLQGRRRLPRFRRLRGLLADCLSEVKGTFASQPLDPQAQGDQQELRFSPLPGAESEGTGAVGTAPEAGAAPFRMPPAPAIAEALARGTAASSRPRGSVDGSPAPAPAALADLRAWLPEASAPVDRSAELPRAC